METLLTMYDLIRRTREDLFTYCETLPLAVYTAERPGVSHGSIRDIHLHVANCYRAWLGNFGLGDPDVSWRSTPSSTCPDVAAMRLSFADVDALVGRFLEHYRTDITALVTGRLRSQEEPFTVSALWLFSHPATHEFHHKGQIVLFGREAGYPAPNTDLEP
jgi:uncharacterized damage-inducible protein DinB